MQKFSSDWFDKNNEQMWSKTVAELGETENNIPEEMEARLITTVKELASCLMSLWRKMAYDWAEDIHTYTK
jgi:flagellar biosynthesis regulator FlaF